MSKRITYTMHHFTQNNALGSSDQEDVPTLLRRVADTIESLGEVEVYDLILHNELTSDGDDWPKITVYFEYKADET
jgi:hypothetical protein